MNKNMDVIKIKQDEKDENLLMKLQKDRLDKFRRLNAKAYMTHNKS